VTQKKLILLCASLAVPALLILIRPLGIDRNQSIVLAGLSAVIFWWTTGVVDKTLASCILLAMFFLFGNTPARTVLQFPLSENFILIVLSFLFSQGISNSGLAEKLLQPLLSRWAYTPARLALSIAALALLLVFIIPQPFARVIILALLYTKYLDKVSVNDRAKEAALFGVYALSVFINMLFIRGDIILNNALLSMGNIEMSESAWAIHMALPSLFFAGGAIILYLFLFRRELAEYRPTRSPDGRVEPLSAREKKQLILITGIIMLWATEALHGLQGTTIVLFGTLTMFPAGLLGLPDLKSVNLKLLIFLTAAFSIGGAMKGSGAADVLFSRIASVFPTEFSPAYIAALLLASSSLHMILGSNITTMSVLIPGMTSIGANVIPREVLLFIIYIAICGHFILPFHNVIILLGEGKGHYSGKTALRFGAGLTVLMVLSIFSLYLGWWKIAGIL